MQVKEHIEQQPSITDSMNVSKSDLQVIRIETSRGWMSFSHINIK